MPTQRQSAIRVIRMPNRPSMVQPLHESNSRKWCVAVHTDYFQPVFTRSRYLPSSVLTLTRSPTLMNPGTWACCRVSESPCIELSVHHMFFKPGSVSGTSSTTDEGSVTSTILPSIVWMSTSVSEVRKEMALFSRASLGTSI